MLFRSGECLSQAITPVTGRMFGRRSCSAVGLCEMVYGGEDVGFGVGQLHVAACHDAPRRVEKLFERHGVESRGRAFGERGNEIARETGAVNVVMFSMKCGYAAKKIAVDLQEIYCITMNTGSLTNQISENVFDARADVFLRRFAYLKERLTKEEMKYLEINGRVKVFQALQNGYGLKKVFWLLKEYRKYGVRFWDWDLIPKVFHYIRVILEQLQIRKRDKEYLVK